MSAMKDSGMSPFSNPLQWLFRASLLVLGTAFALNMAVDLLSQVLPWIAGAFGVAGLTWIGVAAIRWRRSRW
jgi:hypothetical protein